MLNGENCKKNEISFTKRWKISNFKTTIRFEYCPTCFIWNVEQFLYITYESFKR